MPKLTLDYDASVPIDTATPFVIQAPEPLVAPFEDYIPNANRPKRVNAPPRDVPMGGEVLIEHGVDYMSHKEGKELNKARNARIETLAREIYERKRRELNDYLGACKMLAKATPEQLEAPTKEIERALKIRERGRPIWKKDAMDQARKQVYKELRRDN